MITMKTMMPIMATGEGTWDGEYIYVDPMGVILDRHKPRLHCTLPDEEPDLYRQSNVYNWAGGREVGLGVEFRMQENGRLRYETVRTKGEVWEDVAVTWLRAATHPRSVADGGSAS